LWTGQEIFPSSSSGNTNDDNSHTDDLNLTKDHGVDAVIQSVSFGDDSSMISFSCTIFSDVMVEADGNRLSRS
jgi:SET domain-containing protein